MASNDLIYTIPLGEGGLLTDLPHYKTPKTKKRLALNATINNGVLEKSPGSERWNDAALSSGIIHFREYFPSSTINRVLSVTRDGKVYKFDSPFVVNEVTPTGSAPVTLNTQQTLFTLLGGAEETGNPQKLFLYTGNDPVQVIENDGVTRRNLNLPPTEWSGVNQAVGGVLHLNRVFAYSGHYVFVSKATDHEDFTSIPLVFPADPGVGDEVVAGFVYKGRLFFLKKPTGLYFLDIPTLNTDTWSIRKVLSTFGAVTPNSVVPVLDDIMIANSYGTITSLKAVQKFGDVESADVFDLLGVGSFTDNELSQSGQNERYGVYYPLKKQVYFSYRSVSNFKNDRIARIDVKNQRAEVFFEDKDQPNCLALLRDTRGVEKPAYGADDGFIYMMDSENRWVGDQKGLETGYRFDIITPHDDMRSLAPDISDINKNFQKLELVYQPSGDFPLFVEIWIDGHLESTEKFLLTGGSELGRMQFDEDGFDDRLEQSEQIPITGQGRRIAFRCYNEESGQNVRLIELKVYFKLAGQRQRENE